MIRRGHLDGSLSTTRKNKPQRIIWISSWAPVLIDLKQWGTPGDRGLLQPQLTVSKNATKRCFKWHLIALNVGWAAFTEIIMGPKQVSKCSQRCPLCFCLFLCNAYSCYDRSLKENICFFFFLKSFWSNLDGSNNGFLVMALICNTVLLRFSPTFQKKKPAGTWSCVNYSKLYAENEKFVHSQLGAWEPPRSGQPC